eukprot:669495_1
MSSYLAVHMLLCSTATSLAIPIPTQPQYEYQAREIVALTHFNMATFFVDGDPACKATNWNQSGDAKSFYPTHLNVSNWVQAYKALGAKSAVLTAKHGCGFCLWDTNATIPSTGLPYTYSVQYSSYTNGDIVKQFVNELRANGLGFGFYYSLKNNFYLNVYKQKVQPHNTLLPGQQNVTQSQFEQIATQQLTELFSTYPDITEFWFDGGTGALSTTVKQLMAEYLPSTVTYNGQDVSPNAIKWVGTESGMPDGPIWSLGSSGIGDPNATTFVPTGCDTTLQNKDHWFYTPSVGIRDLNTLIQVYHDTVGSNGVLELDFGIDRTGNVAPDQYMRYKEFGDWIRQCYGKSLNSTHAKAMDGDNNMLKLEVMNSESKLFDRVMIQEDLMQGQRVRQFDITINGNRAVSSTVVGHKRILLLPQNVSTPATVTFVLKGFVGDSVDITNFAVFSPMDSIVCRNCNLTGSPSIGVVDDR